MEFRRYVPSYGRERKNDAGSVTKCALFSSGDGLEIGWDSLICRVDLKQKFREMSKQYSPEPRGFYVHLTSVIVRQIALFYSYITHAHTLLCYAGHESDCDHAWCG